MAETTRPTRREVRFRSGDDECAAWLYEPAPTAAGARPAVVMAHGLGAIKEMGLDAYAERIADEGYVVLLFDYRHFGASGGQPRQLLDIGRQLEDWAAALAFVRALPAVDPDRVAVLGSSFGGGHAIVTAARDRRVAAAVAQAPFTSGSASARTIDLRGLPGVLLRAARDEVAARRGQEPVHVALAGPPGSPALMNAPDAEGGYLSLVPDGVRFRNEVAARVANRILLHHPGRAAKDVRCPLLVQVCDHDSVAPARPTLRYAARAPRGEVVRYPIGHFDIYRGEPFERAVTDQIAFLNRHLRP